VGNDIVGSEQDGGAQSENRRHRVVAADHDHRPHDAIARRPRIRDGVKLDENVRQSGSAKGEDQAQGKQVERAVRRPEAQTRPQKIVRHQLAILVICDPAGGSEKVEEMKMELP